MESGEFALSDREFGRVKARVYAEAGISLSDAKRTLVVSRLSKLVRGLDLNSFDSYLDHLERHGSADDQQDFINALTTNLTRFWREDHHFEHLVGYVGDLIQRKPRMGPRGEPELRIWSAGCSTGQEPYTIALTLLDAFPELKRWDFRILATDIDTTVVAKAATGLYPVSELSGLSSDLGKAFRGCRWWQCPHSARRAAARRLQAAQSDAQSLADARTVRCRVLPERGDLFRQEDPGDVVRPARAPSSCRMALLYLGHSENLGAGGDDFRLVGKTIYQARAQDKTRDAA